MKFFLSLVAMVYGAGFLFNDTTTTYINVKPDCIGPAPSGTESCPEVEEIFCASNCTLDGDYCRAEGTDDGDVLFEEEQMNAGTSTEVSVYGPCNPALSTNDCRPSRTVNLIPCSRRQLCECIVVNGNRICSLGDEEIFTLIRYAPRTDGPSCPVDVTPPGGIDP